MKTSVAWQAKSTTYTTSNDSVYSETGIAFSAGQPGRRFRSRFIRGGYPFRSAPTEALVDALTARGHSVDFFLQAEHDFVPAAGLGEKVWPW